MAEKSKDDGSSGTSESSGSSGKWGSIVGRGKSWKGGHPSIKLPAEKEEKVEKEKGEKGFFVRKSSARRSTKRLSKHTPTADLEKPRTTLGETVDVTERAESTSSDRGDNDIDLVAVSNAASSEQRKVLQEAVDKERKAYERKCKEYVQRPTEKKREKLKESEKRLELLERKFAEFTSEEAEKASTSSEVLGSHRPSVSSRSSCPDSTGTPEPSIKSRKNSSGSTASQLSHKPPSGVPVQPATSPLNKRGRSVKIDFTRKGSSPNLGTVVSPTSPTTDQPPPVVESNSTTKVTFGEPSVCAAEDVPTTDSQEGISQQRRPTLEGKPQQKAASPEKETQPATPSVVVAESQTSIARQESLLQPLPKSFQDVDELAKKPGCLSVFLHYLLGQDNVQQSSPLFSLFFYLMTGVLQRAQQSSASNNLLRVAQDISTLFVSSSALLPVSLDKSIQDNILDQLDNKNMSDDAIRNVYVASRFTLQMDVQDTLTAFTKTEAEKEYNDSGLRESMAEHEEVGIIQSLLGVYITSPCSTVEEMGFESAISHTLCAIFDDLGVPLQNVPGSQSKPMDMGALVLQRSQVQSSLQKFVTNTRKRQVHWIAGHQFVATHYNTPTFCDVCTGLLWGIGYQGYCCQACGFIVHKNSCNQDLNIQCTGQEKEITRTQVSLFGDRQRTIRHKNTPGRVNHTVSSEGQVSSSGSSQTLVGDRSQLACAGKDGVSVSVQRHPSTMSKGSKGSGNSINMDDNPPKFVINQRLKSNVPIKPTPSLSRVQSLQTQSKDRPTRWLKSSDDVDGTLINVPKITTLYEITRSDQEEINDSDVEVEEELIPWSFSTEKDFVSSLEKKDGKRQDLINELIHTERTHVKKLKVMHYIFMQPMLHQNLLPEEVVDTLFPNLDNLIRVHTKLLSALRTRPNRDRHNYVPYIGDVMLEAFSGEDGAILRESASIWVQNRQDNVDRIRQLCLRNSKFEQFIKSAEAKPQCSRLQLADLTSIVMQRLTKYPLLLEGVLKATAADISPRDHRELPVAIQKCREALNYVNLKVMENENRKLLWNISKNLEISKEMDRMPAEVQEIVKNLDLPNRELIYNSELQCRLRNCKPYMADVLLFADILIVLERNEDKSRYFLRPREDFSPVVLLNDCLPPRDVAADKEKKSFYLLANCNSMSPPKIYEMVSSQRDICQTWQAKAGEAINSSKKLKNIKLNKKPRAGRVNSATHLYGAPAVSRGVRNAMSISPGAISRRTSGGRSSESIASLSNKLTASKLTDGAGETGFLKRLECCDKELRVIMMQKTSILNELAGSYEGDSTNQAAISVVNCIRGAQAMTDLISQLARPNNPSPEKLQHQLFCASMELQKKLYELLPAVESNPEHLGSLQSGVKVNRQVSLPTEASNFDVESEVMASI